MLKCAPYIKSLCSSLHSGWWRDGTSSLPGSPVRHPVTLPSPTRSENAAGFASINHDLGEKENQRTIGDECIDYDNIYITKLSAMEQPNKGGGIESNRENDPILVTGGSLSQIPQQHDLGDVKIASLLSPQTSSAITTSTAVVSISGNGEIVTSVIVNQPQTSSLNKLSSCGKSEPTSVKSDLIHVLKKIRPDSPDVTRAAKRLEMARRLGAISKIPKQQNSYGSKDINTPPNSPSRR